MLKFGRKWGYLNTVFSLCCGRWGGALVLCSFFIFLLLLIFTLLDGQSTAGAGTDSVVLTAAPFPLSSHSSSSCRLPGVWTEGGGCDGMSDDDLEKITDEFQFCIFTFTAFNIYQGSRVVKLDNYIFKLSNEGINWKLTSYEMCSYKMMLFFVQLLILLHITFVLLLAPHTGLLLY